MLNKESLESDRLKLIEMLRRVINGHGDKALLTAQER
jgi:hypothetical protein